MVQYKGTGNVGKLPWVGLTAAVLVYLQSLLGGLVASRWALHQCFGIAELCRVMNSHLAGVVPPTLAVITLVVMVWRTSALHPLLRNLANLSCLLVLIQIGLGVMTFRLRLQIELLTVSHQAVGAALLGTLVAFTVIALRDRQVINV